MKKTNLYVPLWAESYIYLREGMTITEFSRAAKISHSLGCSYIKTYEERGLITLEKKGRCKLISLTSQGAVLLGVITVMRNTLDGVRLW